MPSAEEMSSSLDEEAGLILFGLTADKNVDVLLTSGDTLFSLSLTFLESFTLAFPEPQRSLVEI